MLPEDRPLFDPASYERFAYTGVDVDLAALTVTGRYQLAGPDGVIDLSETFGFEPSPAPLPPARAEAFGRVARLLWLAAGVSYYKTAAPRVVAVPALSSPERAWLEALYREGLGEFAYENDVNLSQRPVFEQAVSEQAVSEQAVSEQAVSEQAPGDAPAAVTGLELPRRSLVAVGGGKDSCVSLAVLGEAGEAVVPFSIGGHRAARECAEAGGLPLVVARRTLDPSLGRLNRSGALNGHVPVTAIVSLAAVAQALVTGADEVVFSNERSSNVGSFVRDGLPVNHQYSKGLAAERRLRAALAGVTPELSYYSLLRPLSELQIAAVFARHHEFHPVFTSCNAAFRLEEGRRVDRWCGHCPKCRFVFLALAPFLRREQLVSVVGVDLLADATQLEGYRELLGLAGFKPFECVGEIEESQVALALAAARGQWADSALVGTLSEELRAAGRMPGDEQVAAVFAPSPEHELPAHAWVALAEALRQGQPVATA